MKRLTILSLAMLLTSCSMQGSRAMYLAENVNKPIQDEIIIAWGPPESTKALSDGSTVLLYKYAKKRMPPSVYIPPPSISPYGGGLAGGLAGRSQPELVRGTPDTCQQDKLTFDRTGVLREYNETDC